MIAAVGAALAATAGCPQPFSPRPPKHFGKFKLEPEVRHRQAGHRALVTGVRQHALRDKPGNEGLSSLSVDLEVGVPEGAAGWRLNPDDLQLAADVADGTRWVAGSSEPTRPPDTLKVHRDGRWVEVDTVRLQAGDSARLRLRFEGVTPYGAFGPEGSGYFRPVDLQVTYRGPDRQTHRLALVRPDEGTPRWVRDHIEPRFVMFTGAGIVSLDGGEEIGFLYAMTFGGQYDFLAPLYLRWGFDVEAGQVVRGAGKLGGEEATGVGRPYLRFALPVTAGYTLRQHHFEMRSGLGWAAGLVGRGGTEAVAVPHWAVAEFEFVVRGDQQYPFRTVDFPGDVGLYTDLSVQLGNLGPRTEPPGVLWTFGLAIHPGE